jgi:hypothetical protein
VFSRHKALKINLIHFDKERKMSKSFKVAALVAVTAMFLAAPVFAPNVYGQSSPTGTATADVFTTDVEDSMDVHYYSGVEFDKWAGFIGIDNGLPSLGYATRFGDIYLGAWYNGNIARTDSTLNQSVVSQYDLDNQIFTGKETTLQYTNKYTDSNNRLNVLLGVAGMGIKVGFYENLQVWEFPNNTATVTEDANGVNKEYKNDYIVDDYTRIQGQLTPSLQWGMSLEAGDLVIRPKVGFAFGIYRDTNILNIKGSSGSYEYDTYNGELVGVERTNRVNGTINDYLKPEITVGAGFELSSGATIGIEYGIGFDVYNNSYDGSGFGGTAAGTVSWDGGFTTISRTLAATTTTTTAALKINEKTNIAHTITPSFYYSTDEIAEGLSLGFYAEIPIGIGVSTDNLYQEYRVTTKTEYNSAVEKWRGGTTETVNTRSDGTYNPNGGLTETTEFKIGLNAAVGASYALIPGRFTVNAGIGISPFAYTGTATKFSRGSENETNTVKTYDADGKLISEVVNFHEVANYTDATSDTVTDSVKTEDKWDACTVNAAAGFTFNFNDNIALDMSVHGGNSSSSFTLDLTNVQMLFRVKF